MFDTHIHLHLLPQQLKMSGPVLVPAVTQEDWHLMLAQFADQPNVWLALGLHPQQVDCWCETCRQQLKRLLHHPQVVAIGEVGLDAALESSDENQEIVLRQQIRLALEVGKPLILHCVKRYGRLLEILQQESAATVGGIVHGYSASVEVALALHKLGFGIGVGRLILNDKARRLAEAVTQLPAEMLVLETDAPWPQHYGPQDWTAVLTHIGQKIAQLRNESEQDVLNTTQDNARRLLKLSAGWKSEV
ncbi:MAG: TatD family hydrolase [Deltaproteobacteria bacterium]|nr:TatD family hydrolase [Deltaproteobacteria bacterium]